MKKIIFRLLLIIIVLAVGLFFFYFNNTKLANHRIRSFYSDLKDTLKQRGYATRLIAISTKRVKWHNDLQVKLSGAAKDSKHLTGEAIDFVVFDINRDGIADSKDVDIVFNILDKTIIKGKGGIGTYKNESSFINRQMIHIDSRGYKARWAR